MGAVHMYCVYICCTMCVCSLLTKKKPLKVTFGMGIKEHDQEGRLIVAEYDSFYVIGCCKYCDRIVRI